MTYAQLVQQFINTKYGKHHRKEVYFVRILLLNVHTKVQLTKFIEQVEQHIKINGTEHTGGYSQTELDLLKEFSQSIANKEISDGPNM